VHEFIKTSLRVHHNKNVEEHWSREYAFEDCDGVKQHCQRTGRWRWSD